MANETYKGFRGGISGTKVRVSVWIQIKMMRSRAAEVK